MACIEVAMTSVLAEDDTILCSVGIVFPTLVSEIIDRCHSTRGVFAGADRPELDQRVHRLKQMWTIALQQGGPPTELAPCYICGEFERTEQIDELSECMLCCGVYHGRCALPLSDAITSLGQLPENTVVPAEFLAYASSRRAVIQLPTLISASD